MKINVPANKASGISVGRIILAIVFAAKDGIALGKGYQGAAIIRF